MKMTIATIFLAIAVLAYAETLPEADAALIENAGIPIHPDAMFVYGNDSVGFRFASDTSVTEISSWYVEQLGEWSLMNDFGLWALYDGPKGLGFGDVMSASRVTVAENDELPGWHSLDENMTTEIVVFIVK